MTNTGEMFNKFELAIKQVEKRYKYYVHLNSWISMLSIVLSSSIPILISMAESQVHLLLVVSIFSALITLLQTFKSTFSLSDKIQHLGIVVAELKKEQLLLMTRTSPYTGTDEENMHQFVSKISDNAEEFIQHLEADNN